MLRLAALLVFLLATAPSAFAADLTAIGQATTAGALRLLVPRFEQQTGDTIHMQLGNPGVTHDRIQQNPNADLIIVASALHDRLQKEGLVDDTTRVALGQAKIGMAVSAKAKRPVLRDAASFIAFLRRVRTIGLVDPKGGSGTSPPFIKAVEDLGIAAEIAPKYRYIAGAGENVADAIARGEVETGATAIPELVPNKSVKVIGPVPADVLTWGSTTAAYVGKQAANPAEARKFLAFLGSPAAAKAFRAIGLDPVNEGHGS
jgi:molybdate transport system substrate-binding protein